MVGVEGQHRVAISRSNRRAATGDSHARRRPEHCPNTLEAEHHTKSTRAQVDTHRIPGQAAPGNHNCFIPKHAAANNGNSHMKPHDKIDKNPLRDSGKGSRSGSIFPGE